MEWVPARGIWMYLVHVALFWDRFPQWQGCDRSYIEEVLDFRFARQAWHLYVWSCSGVTFYNDLFEWLVEFRKHHWFMGTTLAIAAYCECL